MPTLTGDALRNVTYVGIVCAVVHVAHTHVITTWHYVLINRVDVHKSLAGSYHLKRVMSRLSTE